MKKRDWIILCAVLALALISGLALRLLRPSGGERDMVLVYLGDSLYGAYPLVGERTVLVEQEDGAYNRIRITGERVYMEDANCKNHDCVAMGALTVEGVAYNRPPIVCLPHGVRVELAPAEP